MEKRYRSQISQFLWKGFPDFSAVNLKSLAIFDSPTDVIVTPFHQLKESVPITIYRCITYTIEMSLYLRTFQCQKILKFYRSDIQPKYQGRCFLSLFLFRFALP